MKKYLEYNPLEDEKFKLPELSGIRGEFDGLVIRAYEIFPNFIKYLRKQGLKPGWSFVNDRPYFWGEAVGPKAFLYSLEAVIYELMNIAFAFDNKPRISLFDYKITSEVLTEFGSYCDLIINEDKNKFEGAFKYDEFSLFLIACVVLRVSDLEKLKANIEKLKPFYKES